ncbi:MAG: HEAT repeat domain-containing protein, partial [Planctomycetes bacterium]|nr:HEAT repeat domain-containing protein [Planctomycetota bacterium]
ARAYPGTTAGEAVEGHVRALQAMTSPDGQRAAARHQLFLLMARGDVAALDRVLQLGRETTNDRVRFDVAFLLAQTRFGKSIVPPSHTKAAVELLTKWFDPGEPPKEEKGAAKGPDAALRLWAAVGLASLQDPGVLPLLKEKGLGAGSDPLVRMAVARALGAWRGPGLVDQVVPLLVPLLKDKDLEIRMAGCDALRLTNLDREEVVEPLLEVAKEDPDERGWRAAVFALRLVAGGGLTIVQGATDEERKQALDVWEKQWRRKRKAAKEKE